ncbi:GDNF/GAS1 domain protein [Trichostrongylus colubriformis]|uniref:GDNF/GAS1 domain protein n=1 Tax=Trichostrongylus colubriformis TaxID=6319 RepID=A0AAN8FMT2_TRICO
MREWLVLAIATICSASINGCLHQRSRCLRDSECRGYLSDLDNICGASINNCSVESPSECVHLLWRIQDHFTNSTCVCQRASGYFEECDYFRELIWNHPCERRMNYAGEQRRVKEQTFSLASTSAIVNGSHKRTTRTPLSDQIQQLKTQLSGG